MTTDDKSISVDSARLFELLLKAARTSNKIEVIQWCQCFIENLDPARNFNTVGNNGETVLHVSARSKTIDEDTHRVTISNNSEKEQQSLLIYLLSKTNDKPKPIVNIDKRVIKVELHLHHAVMSNRMAKVNILLGYGTSITVNISSSSTDSYKFQSNKLKSIRDSISNKTSLRMNSKIDYINAKTTDGYDAFSLAETYNNQQILEELFQHIPYDDFQWNEEDKIIFDLIYRAILDEDFRIIDSYPIWLVVNETTGETPLHIAYKLGCPIVVLHLLHRQYSNNKIEPNIIFLREKQNGFTSILSAAYADQLKCFEHMLSIILKLIITNHSPNKFINDIFIDRYGRSLLHTCVLSK
ncbi:unnamed protein product [Rotaria magnacalcarata]|uniref:Ankyrin repeat protein n=1 Tax=Rotaria magnacalcarata TaxID=392030 RepID=A0A816LK11_9BILA|nr:unnamed protein product [Rotaria magnacalcarata]CAF1431590.1 unnamed protein product [Rotaria magnacalcarata]CAF1933324.1 unnamed protein product [Rotaria magnacalcarata]CAF3866460.1 unnamed protein product [Rotaria magnacalcarata]CAF3979297.1 unnamed protein product [Rotaria magnacalcarata]